MTDPKKEQRRPWYLYIPGLLLMIIGSMLAIPFLPLILGVILIMLGHRMTVRKMAEVGMFNEDMTASKKVDAADMILPAADATKSFRRVPVQSGSKPH